MVSKQNGFTLIELMIVITVMGTMAAMLAPGIGEFLADARASAVAEDLVRLSRHIRARTQETGLAHLIVFGKTTNDAGGLGRIRVYEGMNNHCRTTPWPQAVNGTDATGHTPVDMLNLASQQYNPGPADTPPSVDDSNRQLVSIVATGGNLGDPPPDNAVICVEPGGATYEGTANAGAVGYAFTRQVNAIKFTVTRNYNNTPRGMTREVLFPPGGIARFRF